MCIGTGAAYTPRRAGRFKDILRHAVGLATVSLVTMLGIPACERSPADPDVGTKTASPASVQSPDPSKPNIVFVLVDALRADRVGRYGHVPSITPTVDAVANEGVTFESPIAQAPWTQPSIASMFSSYNPSVHQVFSYPQTPVSPGGPTYIVTVFSDAFQTLAECLKAGGYDTASVIANPTVLEQYGFAQGFDHYDTSVADPENLMSGDAVNQAALTWLKQRDTSKPFFLYLHYMDVHGPYDSGPEFVDDLLDAVERDPDKRLLTPVERRQLGYLYKLPTNCPDPQKHRRLMRFREYWIARYEAGVREFDHHFAALKAKLMQMGVWDDAYVIITADHGEALCEHGLWKHGFSTYHTDLHVPLILRWPDRLPAGEWVGGTVRLIDVMPTLLTQLSLSVPKGIQGVSLAPLIAGEHFAEPLAALAEGVKIGAKQRALYRDDWKLIVTLETGRRQLFNLHDDYAEQIDLSAREPERVELLEAMLQELVQVDDRLAWDFATRRTTMPADQLERLKTLGYIGD